MHKLDTRKALMTLFIIIGIFLAVVVFNVVVHKKKSPETDMKTSIDPKSLAQYQSVNGVIDLHFWETKNGVKVYFVPAHELPFMDIQVVFDAGSARQNHAKPIAYFVNILLNEGTGKKNADDIAEQFEGLGAKYGGDVSRDMASVHLRSLIDPKRLMPAVELFAQVVSEPSFPKESLEREKQNALSFLKMQAQNPGIVAQRAFFETSYGDHPYGAWDIGNPETVLSLTLKDLKDFHAQYYTQSNMILTLVGDVSLGEANWLAEKIAQAFPKGEKALPLPTVPTISKKTLKKISFPSEQTHLIYGLPLLRRDDPDYFPLVVGNHILGGNTQSSRVFDIIRGEHGLAYSAYTYLLPLQAKGPFMMVVQTRKEEADKTKALMEEILKTFIEKGPTDVELKDAKQNIIGGFPLRFDSNENILSQISGLGFYQLPLDYFDQYTTNIEKISVEDIKNAFQKHIDLDKILWVSLGESS